eukprot:TRINITY_DN3506_c0_g1_i2.p1 TRINITY_DN3506_c0_g1~~TRINITY_DN3506_c0_g1_i2.p1  ORF type:complete len:237 (-),score=32.78 TRINITY_DN3506_c0_g1_i2:395-1105(-)
MTLYESIKNHQPSFPELDSAEESDHACLFDLLLGMLAKSEEDRLSVRQVLSHPWIVGGGAAGYVDQNKLWPIQLPQVGSISMLRKLSGLYQQASEEQPAASEHHQVAKDEPSNPDPAPALAKPQKRIRLPSKPASTDASMAAAMALFDPPTEPEPTVPAAEPEPAVDVGQSSSQLQGRETHQEPLPPEPPIQASRQEQDRVKKLPPHIQSTMTSPKSLQRAREVEDRCSCAGCNLC